MVQQDNQNIKDIEQKLQATDPKRQINNFLISGTIESQFILEQKMNLAREYDKCANLKPIPNNANRFHFLFLHYQPEASSIPLAGEYADQMLALEYILSTINKDECIVVKEHPRQFIEYGNIERNIAHIKNITNYRSPNFYRECIKINSVYLCPRSYSTKSILKNPKAVIWSPTGTINLEAISEWN